MIREEDITRVGKFQKTHGLKGELNTLLDIEPKYFEEDHPMIVAIEGLYVPFYIESIRKKGNFSYLVKLIGIDSEKEASQFVNQDIFMLSSDKDEWLDEDEFYVDSFIGFEVMNKDDNKKIGKIIGIDDTTENILFLLNRENEMIYIPVVDNFIVEIDEEDKIIVMDLPEGLVNLNIKE